MKKFNNIAEFMNGRSSDEVAREIYNDTECGAQIYYLVRTKRAKTFTVIFDVKKDKETGLAVFNISHMTRINPIVRDFIGIQDNDGKYNVKWNKFLKLVKEFNDNHNSGYMFSDSNISKFSVKYLKGAIEFSLDINEQEAIDSIPMSVANDNFLLNNPSMDCIGISLGSIVEGGSEEVGPYQLRFPFSNNEYEGIIQDVEYDVAEIWEETHESIVKKWFKKGELRER